MAFHPGKTAVLTIAGSIKPLSSAGFTINGEPVDVTNFTSAGWRENVQGLSDADFEGEGPYNGIASGTVAADVAGTSVAVILDFGTSGPALTIPIRLAKIDLRTTVEGVGTIKYTGKSNGQPTITY